MANLPTMLNSDRLYDDARKMMAGQTLWTVHKGGILPGCVVRFGTYSVYVEDREAHNVVEDARQALAEAGVAVNPCPTGTGPTRASRQMVKLTPKGEVRFCSEMNIRADGRIVMPEDG